MKKRIKSCAMIIAVLIFTLISINAKITGLNSTQTAYAAGNDSRDLTITCKDKGIISNGCKPTDPSTENKKTIALTFDDGPSLNTTPLVLDKLEKYNVKASFFLIGQNITEQTKPIMERALSLGCELNSHSWTHSYMDQMDTSQIKDEIKKTSDAMYKMTGIRPAFFRPPYIAINNTMYDAIDIPFICGINCADWDPSVSAETRAQTILDNVKDGDIILLHDFEGNIQTVHALDSMIQGLINKGYTFVTVSELFETKGVNPNVEYKIWSNVS